MIIFIFGCLTNFYFQLATLSYFCTHLLCLHTLTLYYFILLLLLFYFYKLTCFRFIIHSPPHFQYFVFPISENLIFSVIHRPKACQQLNVSFYIFAMESQKTFFFSNQITLFLQENMSEYTAIHFLSLTLQLEMDELM